MPAKDIADDNPIWSLVAHAIAQLMHTLVLTTAARRIIVGGGVLLARPALLARVRMELLRSLNGYLPLEDLAGPLEQYIVAPQLGARAGPLGALALASDADRAARPLDAR